MTKKRVLFLCTGNSARSQIAEALLKHHAADRFDVVSAGAKPEPVHKNTYHVLKQFGVLPNSLHSKSIDEVSDQPFDYVITLCEHASAECKTVPYLGKRLEWNFNDPKTAKSGGITLAPFETCLHDINRRIGSFIELESANAGDISAQTTISATQLFKSLSDPLRLQCLMLIQYEGELCVCELQAALDDIQPKVSRHLALLRKQGLLTDRRAGQWVFYRVNPNLPDWARSVLAETTDSNIHLIRESLARLHAMGERPSRMQSCCAE